MNFKILLAAFLAFMLALFTAQNAQVVEIRFLFWKLEMSRAIVLFLVFGTGAAVGWLFASFSKLISPNQPHVDRQTNIGRISPTS